MDPHQSIEKVLSQLQTSLPIGRQRGYVEKFFAFNGLGPFTCIFCRKHLLPPWNVDNIALARGDRFTVHHADGDYANCSKENLQPSHLACHSSHHSKSRGGWGWNQGRIGVPLTGERRKKHAAMLTKRNKQPKSRRRSSETQKTRWAGMTKEQRREALRPAFEASKKSLGK